MSTMYHPNSVIVSTAARVAAATGRELEDVLQEMAGAEPVEVVLEREQSFLRSQQQQTRQAETQQLVTAAVEAYENGEMTLPQIQAAFEQAGQGAAFGVALDAIATRERASNVDYPTDEELMLEELTASEYQENHLQELQAERDAIAAELQQARTDQTAREIGAFSAKLADAPPAVVALVRAELEASLAATGEVPDDATQDAIIAQAQRSVAAAERRGAEIDSASEQLARIVQKQHSGFGGQFADDPAARARFVEERRVAAIEEADFAPHELLPAPTAAEERDRQLDRIRETTGANSRFQEQAAEGRRAGLQGDSSPLSHFEQSRKDQQAARERIREVDERAAAAPVEPSASTKAFVASTGRVGSESTHHKDPNQLDEYGGAFA